MKLLQIFYGLWILKPVDADDDELNDDFDKIYNSDYLIAAQQDSSDDDDSSGSDGDR